MTLTSEELKAKAALARQIDAKTAEDDARHAEVQATADARQQTAFSKAPAP